MRSAPVVAVVFLVPALSLAGSRRSRGSSRSWGCSRPVCRRAGTLHYVVVGVAVAVSVLTLLSMMKIWSAVFWGTAPASAPVPEDGTLVGTAVDARADDRAAVLSIVVVAAGPLHELSVRAAEGLMETSEYRGVVLP